MTEQKDKEAYGDQNDEKKTLQDGNVTAGDGDYDPNVDTSKVKFINGGADSTQIEVGEPQQEFVGLSKDELMKFATDPYWIRVRWIMLILFWVAWFGMLIAAIVIIVLAPKCPPRPPMEWYQKSVVYQAYPKAFQDTNGDGVGDLKGVEKHLDYLKKFINASAVVLNPIYPSPSKGTGFDVADYKAIDSSFGSMEDFDSLRVAMHKRGMKLILDFVPNHSSLNHTWFQESRKGGDNQYANFYVWNTGKGSGSSRTPPNNWKSMYGGSAWTFDDVRGQYYLHQYSDSEPDLNLREPKVREALKDVLSFWVDRGVDGFRVVGAAHLFESNSTADEPASGLSGAQPEDYDYLSHTLTAFQPETYELLTEWRAFLDQFTLDDQVKFEGYKALIVEANGNSNQTGSMYTYNDKNGADLVLNTKLTELKKGCDGNCVQKLVNDQMANIPAGKWASWMLGNPDVSRLATRMGGEYVNAANMLLLTLPGTPSTYYGDEIGMADVDVAFEDGKDPVALAKGKALYKQFSRDPQRTPMQWSDGKNAGFSNANKTWLPVSSDYLTKNVKSQRAHGAGVTSIEVYTELSKLRQEPSFQWGQFRYAIVNQNIFSFIRTAEGFDGYLVAFNFGTREASVDFHSDFPYQVAPSGEIVANTANYAQPDITADFEVGQVVALNNIHMRPGEGVVFKWAPGEVMVKEE